MKRYRKGDDWFDDFDSFFFEDMEEQFQRMRRSMERMFSDIQPDQMQMDEPFVYGFSMRVGPDGKPVFQEFGNTRQELSTENVQPKGREPLTDVCERENKYFVTLELPGVDKKDIDLVLTEKDITIDVQKQDRTYHKQVTFSTKVDPDSAKATYKNGVLDIALDKVQERKEGKKISID